jgi:tetratricopeptide (TPR) repeat protein
MTWSANLSSRHSGDLLKLHDILNLDSGFRLVFAAYNNRIYRDRLIDELGKDYKQTIIDAKNNPALTTSFQTQSDKVQLLHMIGTEQWFTPDTSIKDIYQLNYQRETLAAAFQDTVVVLWLYDNQITEFAHEAPDLWAWRKAVLNFDSELLETKSSIHLNLLDPYNVDDKDKKLRLENINRYLQDQDVHSLADGQLWLEKSHILQILGLWDDALAAVKQSQEIAHTYQDKRAECIANRQFAHILVQQGNLKQALQIYQKQVLPVFEALGDQQQYANTLGRIAFIAQLQGNLELALINQQQVLSIYEALGDKYSSAITLGRIAGILHQQGNLQQALQIYQQVLDIFKDLNNRSSYALTKIKLADVLQECGELAQALQIYQYEALPIYDKLGDKDGSAIATERIGLIKLKRGELQEALELYQNRVLPIYKQLGNKHGILNCQYTIAMLLEKIDINTHQTEINNLLCLSLQAAQDMRLPIVKMIKATLTRLGMHCQNK